MTWGRGCDVSMITTLSAEMRLRCTSSAGNACRLQNHRFADLVAEPSSSKTSSSSWTSARPSLSSSSKGSSKRPACRWPARMRRLSGSMSPSSGFAHTLLSIESWRQVLAQVAEHHLDLEPAAAEDDRLDARPDPRRRDAACFEHRAAAHAQLAVDEGRVVEDEAPLTARRAAPIDQGDAVFLQQALGELARICDGRRRADEGRARTVEGGDALHAEDDVGHLAAEEAAVGMELVDDDELQARKQPAPPGVMGKDAGVE